MELVAVLFLLLLAPHSTISSEPGLFPETSNVAAEFSATSACGNPPNLYCPPYRQTALIKCLTCNETSGDDVHPGEFAVDGDFSTFWQATTFKDALNEIVNASVSLGGKFQLDRSVITFNTYRPELMILEKSNDNGTTWTPLQYYAANCTRFISIVERMRSELPNESENTIAFCIQQDTFLQDPETGGTVTYDAEFRYGMRRFDVAAIVEHTLVTNLRARFLDLDTRGDVFVSPSEQTFAGYYYAIEEWEVDARCYCYGHSNECVVDDESNRMTDKCVCSHNTAGPNCDRCLPLFNNRPFRRGNSSHANPCEACECHDHADRCVYDEAKGVGVCVDCKHNTTGDRCDSCLPNFFRDPSRSLNDLHVCIECSNCDGIGTKACNASGCICHPNVEGLFCQNCTCGFGKIQDAAAGCESCDCDLSGTVACSESPTTSRVVCDQISGACACKNGVEGAKCDGGCRDGYFNLTSNGCSACTCSSVGTGGNLTCDKVTGQCDCVDGVTGVKCDRCQKGFYGFGRFSGFACRKCYCNAHADDCSLREIPTSAVTSTFEVDNEGWTATSQNSGANRYSFDHDRRGFLRECCFKYFAAPLKYLGNQRASYGQLLTFDYGVEACSGYPLHNTSDSVRLKGGNVSYFLSYLFPNIPPVGIFPKISFQTFTITMIESNFFYKNDSDGGSHRPVTKEDFLNVLGDLEELQIRLYGDYVPPCFYIVLDNVTLNRENATENCTCNIGYEGLFCESCQSGFYTNDSHGGNCQPCDCTSFGSNSTICDNVTGLCACKRGFSGRRCDTDICESSFCYDHADRCVYDEAKGLGVCVDCKHNTTGDRCDSCLPNFFRDPTRSLNDSQVCIECSNCEGFGTKACNASGCICHPNVESVFCRNCTCGFGKIQDAVTGCELCDCDLNGTIACSGSPTTSRVVCDQISGECACKTNVMGPRCDTCKPGFHSLSSTNSDGCTACDCPTLTTSSSSLCDVKTGACFCLPGLNGSRCNEIMPRFFVPGMEGIIYEGEFAILSGAEIEFSPAMPFTGSGCARFGDVGDKAVFEIPVPRRTIRYRLVLRYSADADTGEVEVTVTRSGSDNYSCPSGDSVSEQNVLDSSFTLLAFSDFIEVQAAGTCLQANDTITVTLSHLTAPANWCLDSVVLIPLQADIQDVIIASSEVALAVFSFSVCYTPRTNELTAPTGNCLQFSIEVTAWLFGGAIECGCSPSGTDPTSIGECAPFSGACTCKSNVLPGGKCDTCKDEFFGLSTILAAGCQACPCLSITSTSSVCNKETGQCSCKSGLTGQACDQVMSGYFVRNLEGVYYEGEDAQLMGPKAVTPSDSSMLSGRACAQFEAVGDRATIRLQVPLQTIRYRLRMRYTANANTGIIDFTVTREGNSNYSCGATSVSGQDLFRSGFTLTSTAIDVIDVASDLCLEANDTVILTVTQAGAPSDWCLDAALLMPLESEFGNDVKNNDLFVFPGCYTDRLTELGPPSNPTCEPFAVRAAAWLFDGAFKCDCKAEGANNSAVCQMFGGQCDCFERVNGRTCSRCEYQFFNLSSGIGCEACNCFENGTNPDSCLECNQLDGTCECKANVEPGGKCKTCKDEFFGLRGDDSDGCTACGCSLLTSASLTCDKETGQCPCSDGLQGRTCTEIRPGFYVPNLEGIIYEGEGVRLMGPEAVTRPNPSYSSGRACAQFKAVGNVASFQLRVPLQTIRYRLRMRYSADANTGIVDFTVTKEGNSNYSCGATSVSGRNLFEDALTLTSTAADVIDVVPDLCLEANDTIIFTITQTGTPSDWCLDAALLMPLESEFGNDVKNDDLFVFPGCYNDRLTALGPPSNPTCEPFIVRAAGWLFGRAFECSCDAVGAFDYTTCEAFGGQCDCFDRVIGRTCSECENQFFNPTSIVGCQACNCFENGTNPESFLKCDQMDGTCTCKASVEGDKCTVCKDGFFNLARDGCEPCVCSSVTTSPLLCNKETGQCGCKRGFHGGDCEHVLPSFYVPGLEGIIYEGEDAQLMGPKPVSPIDSSMLSGSACAQFEVVGDKATIRLQVPLQTIRYRLRMRYSADANTGLVHFTVTREGNSNYSCGATSVSGQNLFENAFTLISTAVDVIDVTPDLCLEANGTVILTVTQAGAPSDWCLDAALLMLLESEFGSDVKNNDLFVFPGCYNDRLTELGPPSNPACEPFTVRASGWLFDGAFECHCDSVGANNSNLCDPFGGQCDCADSVIGRTCSACSYNSFNVTSSGCQACDCVEAGTNPSRPCDSTTGECLCRDNFTEERCHLCKSGFKREVVNGNESIPCVPCECNGHSSVCHPLTGVCMNCSNNSVGDFCEECEDGFFGDATSSGSCQACMCSHPLGSNGIVCDKVSGNCSCHVGFVGRICDTCGDGFYDLSNGCLTCNCSEAGTTGLCNSTTGECVCKENFSGEKCDRCAASFFNYLACDPCDCDAQFSVNSTCDESGACTCKTGVEGAKCDGGCRDGYFNLTSNGCSACTCSSVGTGGNLTCDKVTGQCDCVDGVTGVMCDRCQKGFYGFGRFSGIACRKCFCNEHADDCSLREIPTSAITSTFDVDNEGWTALLGANRRSANRNWLGVLYNIDLEFYAAPPKYLGNQLASYGQLFTLDLGLQFSGPCDELPFSNDSVRLKGGNVSDFLFHSFPSNPLIGNRRDFPLQTFTIKMIESNFFYKSDSDRGSHRPVSKEEFLSTLGDLKELQIWAYSGFPGICFVVLLDNVTLNRANATENCTCNVGYEGLSCESCQEGFYANASHGGNCQPCDCASFGSNSTTCDNVTGLCDCKRRFTGRRCDTDICESCFCYGHSDRCAYDEQTGCVCVDCEHNTTGDRCEKCLSDFFRDPGKEPNDPSVCLRKCGV